MGRREDINRHHTIRHTYMPTPRRKISTMLMLMLIISAAMGISVLNDRTSDFKSSLPAHSSSTVPTAMAPPTMAPPTRQQLFDAATIVAGGQWGPELLDDCILLAKGFGSSGDADAAGYASLLAEGGAPDDNSDRLIAAIATDEAQVEVYRTALTLSHQNSLLVKQNG